MKLATFLKGNRSTKSLQLASSHEEESSISRIPGSQRSIKCDNENNPSSE